MPVKSGQAVTVEFTTANPTTGAAADATGTPAGTLYVNGTANAASVTVTNQATGVYKAAVTLPTLVAGDLVAIRISATVATIAGEGIVWQDTADAVHVSDVSAQVAAIDPLDATETQAAAAAAIAAYDPPTNSEMESRTLVAASYATAANQTTILNRLGAWTGTGINTILGAFRALAAKAAALTPTDISSGTTFDNTTDSLESIKDTASAPSAADIADAVWDESTSGHVASGTFGKSAADTLADTNELQTDWANGGRLDTILDTAAGASGGTGARTVVITVNDGASPTPTVLEGAIVRVTKLPESYALTTNASGQVTFNLGDGTWTVAISLSQYVYTGTTLVVDGNETVTYSMSAAGTVPSPTIGGQCTGYGYTYDADGAIESSQAVICKLVIPQSGSGVIVDSTERTETSGVDGLVSFTGLWIGATYQFWKSGAAKRKLITIDADDVTVDGIYALPNFTG